MKNSVLLIVVISGMFWSDIITLEDLQWKNRVLLVFPSTNEDNSLLWEMTDSLLVEIANRDLIYFVFGDSLISNSDYKFEKNYERQLRTKYALGSKEVCWILLGKDGGSKLKKEGTAPDWKLLFATIDSMPMRQKEMNRLIDTN
ncbi:DUF4174 domain-containing protein [Lunatibacter salilacus]|uniref:DUF4174 domain-containing protein n=1 Tax=Lunatibacter salilacus TaxID=2483804 RepID=UPI00131E65B4|nr:DUF4174 domain-containing protein [Lunatibacter salilacus]